MEILTAYWIKIAATLIVFVALMVLFFRQSAGGGNGLNVSSELEKLGEEIKPDTINPLYFINDKISSANHYFEGHAKESAEKSEKLFDHLIAEIKSYLAQRS